MKRRAIFMTGSTGFVGGHLASRLDSPREGCRLFLLARGKDTESAEDRIRKHIPHVNGTAVRGDICESPDLGLSPKDRDLLKEYDLEVAAKAKDPSSAARRFGGQELMRESRQAI